MPKRQTPGVRIGTGVLVTAGVAEGFTVASAGTMVAVGVRKTGGTSGGGVGGAASATATIHESMRNRLPPLEHAPSSLEEQGSYG